MRRIWFAVLILLALGISGVAMTVVTRGDTSSRPPTSKGASKRGRTTGRPALAPVHAEAPPLRRPSTPQGLQLSGAKEPGRLSTAQAIVDDALQQLRRLDEAEPQVATEIYLRGSAALERVDDELDADDEPGRAKLRADTEALRGEMARLFKRDP